MSKNGLWEDHEIDNAVIGGRSVSRNSKRPIHGTYCGEGQCRCVGRRLVNCDYDRTCSLDDAAGDRQGACCRCHRTSAAWRIDNAAPRTTGYVGRGKRYASRLLRRDALLRIRGLDVAGQGSLLEVHANVQNRRTARKNELDVVQVASVIEFTTRLDLHASGSRWSGSVIAPANRPGTAVLDDRIANCPIDCFGAAANPG